MKFHLTKGKLAKFPRNCISISALLFITFSIFWHLCVPHFMQRLPGIKNAFTTDNLRSSCSSARGWKVGLGLGLEKCGAFPLPFQGAVTLIVRIESSWKIVSLVFLFVRVSMQVWACSRNLLLNAPFAICHSPFWATATQWRINFNVYAPLSPPLSRSLNPRLAGLSGKCT